MCVYTCNMGVFPPLIGALCLMLQEWFQSWLTVFPMLMFTRMIEYRHYDTLKVNGCCTKYYRSMDPSFLHHCVCQWKGLRLAITALCLYMCDNVHTLKQQQKEIPLLLSKEISFFFNLAVSCSKMYANDLTVNCHNFMYGVVNLQIVQIYWWCVACRRTKV